MMNLTRTILLMTSGVLDMEEKISKSRGDKNALEHIQERQMLEMAIILELHDKGIRVDKNLILEKLASADFETSLRTLERDIASIIATDAGAIMGPSYSGFAAFPGMRYMKIMQGEKAGISVDLLDGLQLRGKNIRKTIEKATVKNKKTLDKIMHDMDELKRDLKKIEKKENAFRSKYGHLM